MKTLITPFISVLCVLTLSFSASAQTDQIEKQNTPQEQPSNIQNPENFSDQDSPVKSDVGTGNEKIEYKNKQKPSKKENYWLDPNNKKEQYEKIKAARKSIRFV